MPIAGILSDIYSQRGVLRGVNAEETPGNLRVAALDVSHWFGPFNPASNTVFIRQFLNISSTPL